MQRTVISISNKDNDWLNKQAELNNVSKTELIRQAIKLYQSNYNVGSDLSFADLLDQTSGLFNVGDGLEFQQKLRDEWE